jgi:hypothetical protein
LLPLWFRNIVQMTGGRLEKMGVCNPALPLEPAVWRDSDTICALADGERHLGHTLKIGGRWHAFDGTHLNAESNGFRFLGTFASVASAKEAIERSLRPGLGIYAGAA